MPPIRKPATATLTANGRLNSPTRSVAPEPEFIAPPSPKESVTQPTVEQPKIVVEKPVEVPVNLPTKPSVVTEPKSFTGSSDFLANVIFVFISIALVLIYLVSSKYISFLRDPSAPENFTFDWLIAASMLVYFLAAFVSFGGGFTTYIVNGGLAIAHVIAAYLVYYALTQKSYDTAKTTLKTATAVFLLSTLAFGLKWWLSESPYATYTFFAQILATLLPVALLFKLTMSFTESQFNTYVAALPSVA